MLTARMDSYTQYRDIVLDDTGEVIHVSLEINLPFSPSHPDIYLNHTGQG